MKTIRKSLLSKPLSCFLAFLVLFISCSTPDKNVILENENSFQNMSGEQVFRSILFKEGDIGKKLYNEDDIEIMSSLNSSLMKQLEAVKNEIINEISKSNPDYFENFKFSILSNNHNIVLSSLLEARNKIEKIVKKQNNIFDKSLNDYKRSDLKKELKKQNLYGREACVAILVIALVIFIAFIPFATDTTITRLEEEQTVNKIIFINTNKQEKS